MSMGEKKNQWLLDRRTFLKATGAGIAGAAMGRFPFESFTLDEAMAAAAKAGETAVPTLCAMCGPAANCGVYAFTKNGRFTKVAGMKESPVNAGAVCPKGQAAPQWVYSPDRLKYPLKRVGKKGEGKFQQDHLGRSHWHYRRHLEAAEGEVWSGVARHAVSCQKDLQRISLPFSDSPWKSELRAQRDLRDADGLYVPLYGWRLAEGSRLCKQRSCPRLGKTAHLFRLLPRMASGLMSMRRQAEQSLSR